MEVRLNKKDIRAAVRAWVEAQAGLPVKSLMIHSSDWALATVTPNDGVEYVAMDRACGNADARVVVRNAIIE